MKTTALLSIYRAIIYGPHRGMDDEDTHELFLVCEGFEEVVSYLKEEFDNPIINSVSEITDSWPVYVSDAVVKNIHDRS